MKRGLVTGLKCRACGKGAPLEAVARCGACGAALDPAYDWDAVKAAVSRDALAERPHNIWRYRELLPLDAAPATSTEVGWTPLVEAPRLAERWGVRRVWLKCDSVSFPSLSFKDRVVAVAINKALELGISTVGCPSTGNLANAVAAHAARAGLQAWIFIPHNLESGKVVGTAVYRPHIVRVRGTYDAINRLSHDVAERLGWGMVNVNLRPYYAEGSKTMAFEMAEQLGWRLPTAVVAPMAAGSLVTKLAQGFDQLKRLKWVEGDGPRLFGAQAEGCSPIATAVRQRTDTITPAEPNTICKSLAIGNPADGMWAARAIQATGGWAAAVSDKALLDGITLLAQVAGVFAETAGGVTVAGAEALAREGRLGKSDEVVLCLTGNGMKTVEALDGALPEPPVIEPTFSDLERLLS